MSLFLRVKDNMLKPIKNIIALEIQENINTLGRIGNTDPMYLLPPHIPKAVPFIHEEIFYYTFCQAIKTKHC